jgi:hypothetical protein
MEKDQIDINTIWETFKRKLKEAIDENIPSKSFGFPLFTIVIDSESLFRSLMLWWGI